MADRYRRFVRSGTTAEETLELAVVDAMATQVTAYLELHTPEIDRVHVHGASSGTVQAVVGGLLREVGFREEVVHTPQVGFSTRSRVDFAYRLGERRGVIAEIERGGTTTNNHDLKDFWKVHIASDAHHLFLVVPMANWRQDGSARERPFARVVHRMAAFFGEPRREVDVLSAHVFGYGSDVPVVGLLDIPPPEGP